MKSRPVPKVETVEKQDSSLLQRPLSGPGVFTIVLILFLLVVIVLCSIVRRTEKSQVASPSLPSTTLSKRANNKNSVTAPRLPSTALSRIAKVEPGDILVSPKEWQGWIMRAQSTLQNGGRLFLVGSEDPVSLSDLPTDTILLSDGPQFRCALALFEEKYPRYDFEECGVLPLPP